MDAVLTELLHDRVAALNQKPVIDARDFVLLWLQGQRRIRENVAFAHAQRRANELGKPLIVYEGLRRDYPHASARFHRFILDGAADNARDCEEQGVAYAFFLETPKTPRGVLHALAARAALVVTDWLPTFIHPGQTRRLAERAPCRVEAVDAAGSVPLSTFPTAQIGARTVRPRLWKAVVLKPVPRVPAKVKAPARFDWGFEPARAPWADVSGVAEHPAPVEGVRGGRAAGLARLRDFIQHRLAGYAGNRNQPASGSSSWMSPWLHFGFVGASEIALAVRAAHAPEADEESYLEELLVRRELALNFCARVKGYGSIQALPPWAQKSLAAHENDPRQLVSLEDLEAARSPDPVWNASQRQLLEQGRIHGYLRMLWGKNLLTFSKDAAEALRRMALLNDKYALDGRDANSWAGFQWCLGMHDRPFPERAIFGVVRSMTSASALRKLDLDPYLARFGGSKV
jgi:deoxyribodipyrimidine photo-lyase